MPVGAKTIALCMIVKNETSVIRHCLESTLPLTDYILVVDTGSTDGTQQMIRGFLADRNIEGAVIEEGWRDFAYNRNFALERLRELAQVDYCLVIDADDTLELDPGFDPFSFKAQMSHDLYDVPIRQGDITHHRPQLFSNRLPFSFKGVLHEYLQAPEGNITRTTAEGFAIRASSGGGFRSNNPRQHQDDAAVLEQALANETDPFLISRYTFYLAQSYRDCGEKQKALDNYLRRAEQGFWIEEVFISLYEAAKLQEALQLPFDEILATYLRASNAVPSRAEALHGASRFCRNAGRFTEGYEIAKKGLALTQPPNGLCIEPWIYDYGLLDEFAVNAYYAGYYQDSLEKCLDLFTRANLPAHYRERIAANARFPLAKIADKSSPYPDLLLWPTGSIASGIAMAAPSLMARANSDLVTVITPTRDRSQLLRRALKYFREQDYKNIEWQILDDSSSPADWVNDVIDRNIFYERVDKQMTIGEKRNYLVDKARGDIIVQFDDDDYYAPSYVSSMVSTLCDRGADLINLRGWFLYDVRSHFFGYWDLMQKHGLHYLCDPAGVSLRIIKQNDDDWTNNHVGFGFSYAFKKKICKEVKFPHLDWDEDTTFYLNAASSFKTDGVHDAEGICLHVLHKVSTSRCFPQYHLPQFIFHQLFPNLEYICKPKPDELRSKARDNIKAVYPENKQADSTPIELNSFAVSGVPNDGAGTSDMTEVDKTGKPETTVLGTAAVGRVTEATVIEKDRAEQMPIRAKTIGLCMIVKNETQVIRQCLESTLPLIDYILVVDTGSTDGTQQMIREFLTDHGIEGVVVEEAWRDFAYNRTFALARLREVVKIDYALVIDADDTLELDVGFDPIMFKSGMTHDLYDVPIRHGNITHHRPQLFSNRLPFSFKGVLHEYVEAPQGKITRTTIKGFAIRASSGGGFRSNNPKKYQDDAAVLERALAHETDPFLISRYTFYLAQSYRDCGEHEKALTNYVKRSELGYWNEEVYISLLEAGNLKSALEQPFDEVIDIYLAASKVVPHRAESLHAASRFCRLKGRFAEGYEFAKQGLQLSRPETGLFIQSWVYDYGLLDELAVNAYWCGKYLDCYNACLRLLADNRAPADYRGRIQANADFALEKMKELTCSLGESPVIELPSSRDLPSFNICLVSIDQHFPIFEQIIRALQGALNDLNYFCSVKHNALEKGAINIVIGSTAFAARDATRLQFLENHPFIIYQMEQLGDQPFLDIARKEYFNLLEKASHILEYSPSQLGFLRSTFGTKTSLLPASFYRSLEMFRPKEVRDIEVLFYASHTPRRDQLITALTAEGINVKHLYSVYGHVLYDYIRRSKIVLNVHAWPNLNPLETFRLSFLLANRCFVISETGDHNPYGNGVIFSPYEDLVGCCLAFLKTPEVREAVAAEGYLAVRRSDLVSDLNDILKRLPLNEFIYRE